MCAVLSTDKGSEISDLILEGAQVCFSEHHLNLNNIVEELE